jgi:hypothetical protein
MFPYEIRKYTKYYEKHPYGLVTVRVLLGKDRDYSSYHAGFVVSKFDLKIKAIHGIKGIPPEGFKIIEL